MLVPSESSSAVLVMMRSKSVSICNHSRARLVYSSRNHAFSRGYPNFMRSYGGLLEPGSKLALLKSTFNGENFISRLSWSISSHFDAVYSWNVCGSRKSLKKFTKTPIWAVQGRSRSSMLVPLESWSAVLVMISSEYVSICNLFHARWANSAKITISKGGEVPFFDGLVREESLHPEARTLRARNQRFYAIIQWNPGISISPGLESVRVRDRHADGGTDIITMASTRLAIRAVARNKNYSWILQFSCCFWLTTKINRNYSTNFDQFLQNYRLKN